MRDPKTEQYLDAGQYCWEYVEADKIPFARIDLKQSESNPARKHRKIDEDRVISYGMAMLDGVDFPAPVFIALEDVAKNVKANLLVASGMHRLGGAKEAGKTHTDGYVVNEPDEYRRDALIYSINNIEGKAPDPHDQILSILELHEKYPSVSLAQFAKEWHIKVSSINNVAKVHRAVQRAQRFAIDLNRLKIGPGAIRALGSIWDDLVFETACRFVINYAPQTQEIDALCQKIRSAPHEQKASLDIIKLYEEDAEEKRKQQRARLARTPQGPAEKFHSNSKTLLNRYIEPGLEKLHLPALARPADLRMIWESLIAHGKRIVVELNRIEEARARRNQAAASSQSRGAGATI